MDERGSADVSSTLRVDERGICVTGDGKIAGEKSAACRSDSTRQIHDFFHRLVTGFAAGYAATAAWHILSLLFRRKISSLSWSFLYLPSHIRFASFVALLRALPAFVRAQLISSQIVPNKGSASALAGAVSGLSFLLITDNNNYLSGLSLYCLVRAGEILVRHFWEMFDIPSVPHADTLIFVASCTEIMHAWFYHPHTIPDSYRSWITRMAKMDTRLLELLRRMKTGQLKYGVRSDYMQQYCKDWKLDPSKMDFSSPTVLSCKYIHPQDPHSCVGNSFRRFWNGFGPSVAIYAPVHIVPVALLNRQSFLKTPFSTCLRILFKILQSSAFLSGFIALIWYTICLVRNRSNLTGDRREYYGPLLGSFMCGWSVLIERRPRRIELALKVLPEALISVWRRMEKKGFVKSLPYSDVGMFSFASAVLTYYHHHDQSKMKSSVRALMNWFLQ